MTSSVYPDFLSIEVFFLGTNRHLPGWLVRGFFGFNQLRVVGMNCKHSDNWLSPRAGVSPIPPGTVRGVRVHDIKFAWHGVLAEPFLGRRGMYLLIMHSVPLGVQCQ